MKRFTLEVKGIIFHQNKGIMPPVGSSGFILRREPDNHVDRYAIRILDLTGETIGWVPRTESQAVAELLDMGIQPHQIVVSNNSIQLEFSSITDKIVP